MKRLQVIQSNIEPDKNVLWLDKYKNLKLYNGDGWENIPKGIKTQSDWLEENKDKLSFIHNKPYVPNNLKTILDSIEGRLKSLEMIEEEILPTIKNVYLPNGFIQSIGTRSVQIIDVNNEPVDKGEVIYLMVQDNNVIDPITWNNPEGVNPLQVLLEPGKFYTVDYIPVEDPLENVEYLSLVPYTKSKTQDSSELVIRIDAENIKLGTKLTREDFIQRCNITPEDIYNLITTDDTTHVRVIVEMATIVDEGRDIQISEITGRILKKIYDIDFEDTHRHEKSFIVRGYWEHNVEFEFEVCFSDDKFDFWRINVEDYNDQIE
jgi:hypothetical protein